MIESLRGRGVPGQFGLNRQSGNVPLVPSWMSELTVSRARMCIDSWLQVLGPAAANARVPKCVTEEQTRKSPRVADWSLSAADGCERSTGQRCTTVPVHPCRSADTAWTGRAAEREASRDDLATAYYRCLMWSCFLAPMRQIRLNQVDTIFQKPRWSWIKTGLLGWRTAWWRWHNLEVCAGAAMIATVHPTSVNVGGGAPSAADRQSHSPST